MAKTCNNGGLPEIKYNPIYNHPDWSLIPNKPNRFHGGTGIAQWEHYINALKEAYAKATLPEAKFEMLKLFKNAKRHLKQQRRYEEDI